jgi:FMN-dependent NADH-azoreductase
LGSNSVSRDLSAAVVAAWQRKDPTIAITYRDLAAEPVSHLSDEILNARQTEPDALSNPQLRERELSDTLIEEFLAADIVVVGAPMYNFAISSQLKTWIDRIVQAGRTFRYTESGAIGLVRGKRVVIASSRGGVYTVPGRLAQDHQETYLRLIFEFLGITDIEIVRAEGLALSPAHRARSIEAAHAAIAGLSLDAA